MTSPRPWRVRSRLGDGCIVDRNGFGVANEVSIMDAKLIAQAVNAHDELVDEVRRLKGLLTGQHEIKGGLELETEALRSEVRQLKAELARHDDDGVDPITCPITPGDF